MGKEKRDCCFYNGRECKALNDLYCRYEKCKFYKTENPYEKGKEQKNDH